MADDSGANLLRPANVDDHVPDPDATSRTLRLDDEDNKALVGQDKDDDVTMKILKKNTTDFDQRTNREPDFKESVASAGNESNEDKFSLFNRAVTFSEQRKSVSQSLRAN